MSRNMPCPFRAADRFWGTVHPGQRLRLALGCYAPAFQGKDSGLSPFRKSLSGRRFRLQPLEKNILSPFVV